MKLIKATRLAKALGIRRQTVSDWCRRDPTLSVRVGRDYWIKIEELAKRPGMDIIAALTILDDKWVKAVDLARLAKIPRRTMATWCKTRPQFARRIGRNWYLSLEVLGATQDQADFLKKWAPEARSSVKLASFAAELGQTKDTDE